MEVQNRGAVTLEKGLCFRYKCSMIIENGIKGALYHDLQRENLGHHRYPW